MAMLEIPLALTGKELMEALSDTREIRIPLVEGFLYEQTIVMMSADPGTGKSTISTQMAVEMASGLPVFGMFKPVRPLNVLYVQTERSIIELIERIDLLSETLPINFDNLYITAEYQKLNLLKDDHVDTFIQCVKRDCPQADVIIIDPIYSIVRGGLKDDTPASIFTKVMTLLQKETGATLWYNHHTSRSQYHNGQAVEKDDPFYGSQWLKAHVTGSYYLKAHEKGVKLELKKDNYGIMPKSMILEYDPESGLCSAPLSELSGIDRLRNYLNIKDVDRKNFCFLEMVEATKLSTRTLRTLLLHSSISNRLNVVSSNKNKNIYQTIPPTKGAV